MIVQSRAALYFKVLLAFTLSISSLSADVLTQYRNYGIQNLEKKFDQDLSKRDYWDKYLENRDTTFGYIESYDNILTCDKSQSTLTLYMRDDNNSYSLTKEYSAFTGKMKGDKNKEGDLKTPIGVYTLTKKLSKVDSFYGPLAFVTSYPNSYDKYKGKDGSGIWIHGLPINQERDSFTKGCIAINNQNIKCLDRHIDISKTILLINEKNEHKSISKDELANVLAGVYAWRYSWLYNETENYLNFYDKTFRRFDGINKKDFSLYKTRVFNKNESKKIIFNRLNIIPYPGTENLFKVTFYEIYKSNSFSFTGDKVLILKLEGSKIQIITEK